LSVLAVAAPARAHGPASPQVGAFVATVSSIDPNVVGLEARVILYDELVVANRTLGPVVILDSGGRVLRRIPSGDSFAWHDPRVVASRAEREAGADPGRVKNWRIPGRAAGKPFAIEGFLGYVPPRAEADEDESSVLPKVVAVAGLVAFAGAGIYLLERRRARSTS
jgi:hypothetical protein